MNSRKLFYLVLALVTGLALTPAGFAQLTVSKAITGINADGVLGFEITDAGGIAVFLENVPHSTVIEFEVMFAVTATGMPVDQVVVADKFGAELDVVCVVADQGICTVTPKGKAAERLRWEVGNIPADTTLQLVVTATTNLDPGGFQRYTECGVHYLNSGPTAKGRVPKNNGSGTMQVSDVGDSIELMVSGLDPVPFPQCSNCIDDDGDLLIDYPDDPGCVDSLDDDESDG